MLTIPVIKKQLNSLHADDPIAFTSECKVFINMIMRRFESSNVGAWVLYQNYTEAAHIPTALYKLCMTCGHASARVECIFSALSCVDSPRRCKSSQWRDRERKRKRETETDNNNNDDSIIYSRYR